MSHPPEPDPLQPALEKAQAELAKHLEEACETQTDDVTQSSAEELLRLEEELLAAARAADEAARIRRRLDQRSAAVPGATSPGVGAAAPISKGPAAAPAQAPAEARAEALAEAPSSPPQEAGGRVREFRDRQGQPWRVWEVRPGVDRPLRDMHRYLGAYVNGWLAFGRLDNELRKRLPKYPPDWLEMSDQELEALLLSAVDVPPRRTAAKVEGAGTG